MGLTKVSLFLLQAAPTTPASKEVLQVHFNISVPWDYVTNKINKVAKGNKLYLKVQGVGWKQVVHVLAMHIGEGMRGESQCWTQGIDKLHLPLHPAPGRYLTSINQVVKGTCMKIKKVHQYTFRSGTTHKGAYAYLTLGKDSEGISVNLAMHRFACYLKNGIPSQGFEASHLCGCKDCCNPHHLQWVPHAINLQQERQATKWLV